jgi:hypothetical protein
MRTSHTGIASALITVAGALSAAAAWAQAVPPAPAPVAPRPITTTTAAPPAPVAPSPAPAPTPLTPPPPAAAPAPASPAPPPAPIAPQPQPQPQSQPAAGASFSLGTGGTTYGYSPSPGGAKRKGTLLLGLGLGLESCFTSGCDDGTRSVGLGPIFQFEVGARLAPMLEVLAAGSYSIHPATYRFGSADLNARGHAFGTVAGVRVRPIDLSSGSGFAANIDPWIGVLGGFHWYNENADDENSTANFHQDRQLRRVLAKFQLGVDYWFDSRMTLGLFFSYDRQFFGSYCSAQGSNGDRCLTIKPTTLGSPDGTPEPSEFPQFFSIGLGYHLYL